MRFEALEERTLLTAGGAEPNDPQFAENPAWLKERYHHDLIETPAAWESFQNMEPPQWGGEDVLVAVVSSGVDLDHPDLVDRIWDGDRKDDDTLGDGTECAGIIAATTNNEIGVAGIAGNADIMPLYGGARDEIDTRCDAFKYATDNAARIVYCNIAGVPPYWHPEFADYRDALDRMYAHGVLHLYPAGNDNEGNPEWHNYDQTVFVAASDRLDRKWKSGTLESNYGTGVDISAPGEDILTTKLEPEWYGTRPATGAASSIAAGVAALIWSQHPDWTRDQVAAQLIGTTDPIDDVNSNFGREIGSTEYGLDGMLGSGRVNASRAVNETLPPPNIERALRGNFDPNLGYVRTLTIDLANVFKGPEGFTFDPDGNPLAHGVAPSPIDLAENWQLVWAGPDGIFGDDDPAHGGDDVEVTLKLDFLESVYTALLWKDAAEELHDIGYLVGTNDLQFSFDMPDWHGNLQPGYYRFTGFAYHPTSRPDGLRDPFDQPLDGDGDGDGGDDFVRDFYVGTPHALSISADDDPGPDPNGSDNGQDDTFRLSPNADQPEYVDIFINENLYDSVLLMELTDITINGSWDNDTVTVEYLPLAKELGGSISISGGGGVDGITLYGSAGDDTFRARKTDATLTTAHLTVTATDFEQIEAVTAGGSGKAHLYYDTGIGEHLEAEDGWARLSSGSAWSNKATGFDTVYVHTTGNDDTPEIARKLQFDLFTVDPTRVCFWDEWGDGEWNETITDDSTGVTYTRWLDAEGNRIPIGEAPDWANADPVVERDTVTAPDVAEGFQIGDLTVVHGRVVAEGELLPGNVTIARGGIVATPEELEPWHPGDPPDPGEPADLTFGTGGAVIEFTQPEKAVIVGGVLSGTNGAAALAIDGGLEFLDEAEYVWKMDGQENNVVQVKGGVGLAGTLTLQALDRSRGLGLEDYGDVTRTIIETFAGGTIEEVFSSVPAKDHHIGRGLFVPDTVVTYEATKACVHLFEARGGDTDGNHDVGPSDLAKVVTNWDPAGTGHVWTEGDFNGDGAIGPSDLSILVRNWSPAGYGNGGGTAGAGAGGSRELLIQAYLKLGLIPPDWLYEY